MNMEERKIYEQALDKFGINNQVYMLMEECGELMSALGKAHRGRLSSAIELITEIADVSIMLEQMAVYFGYDVFLKEKERKLKRLEERIENFKAEVSND